jgi:hypothetical protein
MARQGNMIGSRKMPQRPEDAWPLGLGMMTRHVDTAREKTTESSRAGKGAS